MRPQSHSAVRRAGLAVVAVAVLTILWAPGVLSAQDIRVALDSLVRIVATRQEVTIRGTGFVIAVDAAGVVVVTSSHVLEGVAGLEVTFAAGASQTTVGDMRLETENRHGVALFRVRGQLPPSLKALELSADRPALNQSLSLMGYPAMSPTPLTLSRGYAGQKGRLYTLDQQVGEGFSGGPVLLEGRVIGMVTAMEGGFTYAIPSAVVREFVNGSGIALPTIAAPPQGSPGVPTIQVNPDPDNLVVDDQTRLMWTKVDNGQDIVWNEAMRACEDLRLGGFSDWRLPSIEELEMLHDPNGVGNIRRPFRLTFRSLWSATKVGLDSAWVFDFPDGRRYANSLGVWTRLLCVRAAGK